MFEAPMFYNFMTARKNMQILKRFTGNKFGNISEVLEIVGLSYAADVKVGEYSQGMRQRLGIAQALAAKPELLILDEPTNALDPAGRKEMKDLIQKLAFEDRITIFLSSHLLTEIEEVCTRAIIINKGKILASKEMAQLREEGVTSLESYFLELTQGKN
jgi:ABC-2 type transport system ATP-binding protein